ncbi:globin domain-containing protein [Nocardia bovistercoris]|uniref:nitric oxide dioxygenase n=1 Tax=Nocardia bovistercoris TaxID=2785916 RepID=A0A931IE75_9NOCA|nr:globin domain-containing protein [Nocardia bovistercoris]MBH0779576.1 hemin transporter [Nocardia bovistercoris]
MNTPVTTRDRELSPEHAEVVRATLPLVGAHIDEITAEFYRTLFGNHPDLLRNLFNRGNQAEGTQPRALAASIARFATCLVDPDLPHPAAMLSRIGHKHASLGITADQYEVVHDNLFAAIVAVLGADVVTEPVAAAWDSVYWAMADTLIELERRLYAESGVEAGAVYRTATVVSRVDDAVGVAVFTVESAADPLPEFVPGQYISVGVTLPDGARQLRQYSLVGAPGGGRLSFAVKRVAGGPDGPAGEVSNRLHDTLGVGDVVEITLPFGDVTLDTASSPPLVLLSAGIGITPMIGMLEYLAVHDPNRTVLVAHADRAPHTHPLRTRLLELAAQLPGLNVELWYSEPAVAARQGRLDLSALDLPAAADYFLCGGAEFLRAMRTGLRERGVAADRVHSEQFTPTDWRDGTA